MKNRIPIVVALALSTLFSVVDSHGADFVETYTPEQFREMALYYKQILDGKEFETAEPTLKAMEFKGYVAGALDNRERNSNLNECVRRNTLAIIAARTASVYASTPLDRGIPAATTFWVALHFACDEETWKKN